VGGLEATVVRGATFAGIGFALTQAVALAFYVVMARLAGPSVFGAFAAASLVVGVTSLFAESGTQGALIQRRDRLEEAAATAVITTFAAGIGLSLVALASAPLVGLYFHNGTIGAAAAAMSGVLFLNAATAVPDALMQRRFSFLRRVVVDPLNMATYGIVGTITLATGMGIWGLVVATYAAGVVRVSSAWILNRWRPNLRLASWSMWRELASFGRHIVASELLRETSTIANIALIGRIFGTAPLGQFRFGQRLATQIGTPIAVASAYVLFPALSRIADDEQRLRAASRRSLRIISAAVFPLGLALIPLGEPLVEVLLGRRWAEAGRVLAALCGVTMTLPLVQTASEICKAANAPRYLPRINGVAAITSVGLLVAGIPFGVVAVAAALSVASTVVAAYSLNAVANVIRYSVGGLLAELAPAAIAATISALVASGMRAALPHGRQTSTTLGLLLLEGSVAALCYLVALRHIGPALFAELVNVVGRRDTRGHRP
jgi:O-antigen/teichoic acid export membrane protein